MENENMKLWEQVCITDPGVTKKVTFSRKFTAIDAQSQIKKATELWGPFGSKWGIKDERFTALGNLEFPSVIYTAQLFYPGGELPIHSDDEIIYRTGDRKGKYNDDFTKKIATDALTKGLSKLGFNSDVFEGKFDDNKYVQALQGNSGGDGKGKAGKEPSKKNPAESIKYTVQEYYDQGMVLIDKMVKAGFLHPNAVEAQKEGLADLLKKNDLVKIQAYFMSLKKKAKKAAKPNKAKPGAEPKKEPVPEQPAESSVSATAENPVATETTDLPDIF